MWGRVDRTSYAPVVLGNPSNLHRGSFSSVEPPSRFLLQRRTSVEVRISVRNLRRGSLTCICVEPPSRFVNILTEPSSRFLILNRASVEVRKYPHPAIHATTRFCCINDEIDFQRSRPTHSGWQVGIISLPPTDVKRERQKNQKSLAIFASANSKHHLPTVGTIVHNAAAHSIMSKINSAHAG